MSGKNVFQFFGTSLLALTALSSAWSSVALAVDAPQSKEQFCAMNSSRGQFKDLLYSTSNFLAFSNHGGLLNGGVCWWHSMLTRNAAYLAVYQPNLPKPDKQETWKIIQHLVKADAVTYVPGYKNLREFSAEHEDTIESVLEAWQIIDGGVGFSWVRGITGFPETDPASLKQTMDELYDLVANKHEAVYQMLGMSGPVSHAWLVVDIRKESDGYTFTVVDSNYTVPYDIRYRYGSKNIYQYGGVVPYNSRFMERYYKEDARKFCDQDISNRDLDQPQQNN